MPFSLTKSFTKIVGTALLGATVAMTGCKSFLYSTTGDVLNSYGQDELMPYLLGTDDTVMACHAGEALTPLLLSFSRVGVDPNQIATMVWMVAGSCEENLAFEEELRYMRSVKAGNVNEAQDARIAQKRHYINSAKREYKGYLAMSAYFGVQPGDKCPSFKDDNDQMSWLIGNLSGILAVFGDSIAEGNAGVPKDIAVKAERAMTCLDPEKWWGVPLSVRAALWTVVPGVIPAGEDAWKQLRAASIMGEKKGVRLAHALEAIAAGNAGKTALVREIIKMHVNSKRTVAASKSELILDTMAGDMILQISDRMWTEATGKRTPLGGLGTFWDEKPKAADTVDIGDIL